MSVLKLQSKLKAKIPVTVLTAYDTPSARLADEAGIDMILIGDSVGMVALGEPNTVSVTMDTMVHHCKAVTAAKPKHSMVVGDMPFGSYLTVEDALANAARLMKEGKVDAVKLEGGKRIQPIVEALVSAGIVVVGHVGLCPQSAAAVGGFRVSFFFFFLFSFFSLIFCFPGPRKDSGCCQADHWGCECNGRSGCVCMRFGDGPQRGGGVGVE